MMSDMHDSWDVVVIDEWLDTLPLRGVLAVIVRHRFRCIVHGRSAGDAWLLSSALTASARAAAAARADEWWH